MEVPMPSMLPHIERSSSIEREPRTLGIDQIQSARVSREYVNFFLLVIFVML